jgi:hypothetical protein
LHSAPARSPLAAFAVLAVAAVVLGVALQIGNGFYVPRALAALAVSLILTIVGVLIMPAGQRGVRPSVLIRIILACGIGVQLVALYSSLPGLYLGDAPQLGWFKAGVVAEGLLILAGVSGRRRFAAWWFAAVLAVNAAMGVWMLRASPNPRIDVVEVHRSALRALGVGRNPYTITFRNIYGPDTNAYNPQAVVGNRINFGYPYPPLSLIAAVPGHVLFDDYRYSQLAAIIAAAALIGYAGASLLAQLAAVLLLTTPRVFFVLEQGWTEPIAVLLLAATVAAMLRRSSHAAWLGGLLVATKQYLGLAVPLLWKFGRLEPEGAPRFLARAAIAGAIVTLPFVVWNVRAFVDTVLLLQTKEPFRVDSLSFVSWAAREGWGRGTFVWAIGAALTALAFVLWRAPNTAAGFAASVALSTLAMFAMGSKAFCNYYFFVIGGLCCALGALAAAPRGEPRPVTPTSALSGREQTEV